MNKKTCSLKPLLTLAIVVTFCGSAYPLSAQTEQQQQVKSKKAYGDQDWNTLTKHPVPEWFADAKFGIYAHWGVYSVPAFGNEWYPRNMYLENNRTFKHHQETYGDQGEFGYKDFIPSFTAEKFDAEEWAELYEQAGARFAGPVAEHHDGFSMWASKVNRWNSVQMGPKRDITKELVDALRKRQIKIVTSLHHAYNFQGYYTAKEGWDTGNPAYGDLYGQFKGPDEAHDRWLEKIKEVIDAYQPDQIWFDFGLAKIPDSYKQKMAAYYYNKEAEWGRPVIITRKGDHLPEGVGVLDIERGKMDKLAPFLWQTDDSVAINSWCWVQNLRLKPAEELVHELIDIVSKNGVLLLNVCPKADGTIPENQKGLLMETGNWLKVNGEAIYGTRPWKLHGEGPNLIDAGRGFTNPAKQFTAQDIRFTRSKDGKYFYAITLGWPEQELLIESLHVVSVAHNASIHLLGYERPLKFQQNARKQLVIEIPQLSKSRRPGKHAYVFKLTGFELELHQDALFSPGIAITLMAEDAVLEGSKVRLEEHIADRPNIGAWDDPRERVHWLANIPQAGTYVLRGDFAAAAGASSLTLVAEGKAASFEVPRSNSWARPDAINAGEITFDGSGVYHLVLRPTDPASWKPVNVWKLQLAPKR